MESREGPECPPRPLPLGIRDQRAGWGKREPRIGRGVKPSGLLAGTEQHSRAGVKALCMIGFVDPSEWGWLVRPHKGFSLTDGTV